MPLFLSRLLDPPVPVIDRLYLIAATCDSKNDKYMMNIDIEIVTTDELYIATVSPGQFHDSHKNASH